MYIAHINEKTGKVQSVKEHNENVAKLCRQFSIPQLQEICFATGELHDIGKYAHSFQRRINGENIHVDHSTAGAAVMQEHYGMPASMIAGLCIAGHHAGIPDVGIKGDSAREDLSATLRTRIAQKLKRCEKDPGENFDTYKDEISLPEVDEKKLAAFISEDCKSMDDMIDKLAFIVRYCFSCLVDADSIDTGEFCGTRTDDVLHADFPKCLERVSEHIDAFTCETELQKAAEDCRSRLLRRQGRIPKYI